MGERIMTDLAIAMAVFMFSALVYHIGTSIYSLLTWLGL